MIFQDPMACLNPRMRVIDIIAEGIDIHKLAKNKKDREEKVYKILEAVGLSKDHADVILMNFLEGNASVLELLVP